MAAYSAERRQGTLSYSGSPGVATFSPATNCVAGNTLVMVIAVVDATALTVASVTDSVGNTWTVDVERTSGAGRNIHICSTKQNIGPVLTSTTVTVTMSAAIASATTQMWLEEFTGQYSPDVVASQTGGTGTSVVFGTTAATASTDEFAVIACTVSKSGASATWTWTKDANYTNFTTAPPIPNASGTLNNAAHYRLLSATGTQTATDTVNNTTNGQAAVIATYKADAVAYQPRSGAVNFQDPGVFAKAWRRARSGIFVPRLWLPEGATI